MKLLGFEDMKQKEEEQNLVDASEKLYEVCSKIMDDVQPATRERVRDGDGEATVECWTFIANDQNGEQAGHIFRRTMNGLKTLSIVFEISHGVTVTYTLIITESLKRHSIITRSLKTLLLLKSI